MPLPMCRACFSFDTIKEDGKCRKCESRRYIVQVDEHMKEPLEALWKASIFTDNCCGGHVKYPRFYAYVLFSPNLIFADWLSRKKFEIGHKFKPVEVGVGERGFTQIRIKEPHQGMFADKTKERHIETFKNALLYIAEEYQKEYPDADGVKVQRSVYSFRNTTNPF